MAGTLPEESEVQQGRLEFKGLVSLSPSMSLYNSILQVKFMWQKRERWVVICPQPLRAMVIWEPHWMTHWGGIRTVRRVHLDWYLPVMRSDVCRQPNKCTNCQSVKPVATLSSSHLQGLYAGVFKKEPFQAYCKQFA